MQVNYFLGMQLFLIQINIYYLKHKPRLKQELYKISELNYWKILNKPILKQNLYRISKISITKIN